MAGAPTAALKEELATLLLAGQETTANALAFLLQALAERPESTHDLREQIDGLEDLTIDALRQATALDQFISEALRLYPPSWVMTRRAREADLIDGYRIPRGSMILISPFVTHRNPRIWQDPERFAPQRFNHLQAAGRHPFAFLPFSAGPRVCPGGRLARIEMAWVAAAILSSFDLEPLSRKRPGLEPGLTMRPSGTLYLKVTKRHGKP